MKKFYYALVRTNSQARLGEWASGNTKVTHPPRHPSSKIEGHAPDKTQKKMKKQKKKFAAAMKLFYLNISYYYNNSCTIIPPTTTTFTTVTPTTILTTTPQDLQLRHSS